MATLALLVLAVALSSVVAGSWNPYTTPHHNSFPDQVAHPSPLRKGQYLPERPTPLKGHYQAEPVGPLLHDVGHGLHAAGAAAGPVHPRHPYGSGGPFRTEHLAASPSYAASPPPYFPQRQLGVGAIFADLSPEKIRALNRFITSICRMCKYKRRYKSSYGKSEKYGHDDYAADNHGGHYEEDEEYHDEDEDYDYHPFARSLFGPAENDNSTSTSKSGEENLDELKPEEIPSVSRAKRSTDYQWPNQHNHYNHGGYYYDAQHRQPYGYHGYVQDSYFQHNPHYLYSKLAYIEHKLNEKRRKRRRGHSKRGGGGGYKTKSHNSKTGGGYKTKGHKSKDKSESLVSKLVSNYGVH